MPDTIRDDRYVPASENLHRRLDFWNRRLLTVAIVIIVCAASVLLLQAAGPDARALMAGEGMLITDLR
jgi:Mn2+/Fe2+ NRAMP family transporter